MIQVIPALMTFAVTNSLIWPRTMSSRSPILSLIQLPQRRRCPSEAKSLKTSTVFSIRCDERLADELGDPAADVLVGESEDLQDEVEDPLEVERLREGERPRRRARRRASPSGLPCRWLAMLSTKRLRPAYHAADQVAEEADRVGDDVADDIRRLGEDVEQHVLELDDRLDDADDGVERLVDEALVGGLSSPRSASPACRATRRTSGRACRRARPACCRSRSYSWSNCDVELALGLLADLRRSAGSCGDVLLDLGACPARCARARRSARRRRGRRPCR